MALGIRNRPDAERPQVILFDGVFAHLIDLRVNATVDLKGQPMFEAVKIEDALFHPELTTKLRAQTTVTQQIPRGLLRLSGARSQFTNSRGGDTHGQIISAYKRSEREVTRPDTHRRARK
jgi:hypothetical protein